MAPYGRLLNSNEQDQGRRGSSGFLGSRTEQFALGSLYYLINYGFKVYGDRCLTENPREHGRKVVDLLQNMEFPKLDGDPLIDKIISKCWQNKYATIAELATYTETLRLRSNTCKEREAGKSYTPPWRTVIGRMFRGLWNRLRSWWDFLFCHTSQTTKLELAIGGELNGHSRGIDQKVLEDISSKKILCQNLEQRRLLQMLSSGEPEQLGFTLEW